MKILMCGDVVGPLGCSTLLQYLPQLKQAHLPDVIVVNGENAANNGKGITRPIAFSFFEAGVDCITLGNHTWGQKQLFDFIDEEPRIIRPANYPKGTPGIGFTEIKTPKGKLTIINLLGRTFMAPMDCPFQTVDNILERVSSTYIIVDMHAEATSEKLALAHYLDGRVSAVVGTHTHIQTADERILPKGTGYITDVGMVGPYDSILGMEKELIVKKFITGLPVRFEVAKGRSQLNAVLVDISLYNKAEGLRRIRIDDDNPLLV